MKRTLLFTFILVLSLTTITSANAWSWWAPSSPSNISNPSWTQPPLWPELQPKPKPTPQPKPPAGNSNGPLQPVEPSNPGQQLPPPSPSLTADEQYLVNQVNQERLKRGLNALRVEPALVSLAKQKSQDMARNGYFDHVSPTLGTVYTMLDSAGIAYSRAGENIARAGSVARAHQLFMESSGHRVNVLHAGYTHVGVGIVKQGTSYLVTQIFIKK